MKYYKINIINLKIKNGNFDNLKIGIIGVGHIGTLILTNILPFKL